MVSFLLLLLPAMAVSTRLNACGSDVTDYENHLDIFVDVPIELLANMALGNMTKDPLKDLYSADYYHRNIQAVRDTISDVRVGNWTTNWWGTRSRTISQRTTSEPSVFFKDIQTINDRKQFVEVLSIVTPYRRIVIGNIGQRPKFIKFEVVQRTCISSGPRYQVDVMLTVPEEVRGKYTVFREITKMKMREMNSALATALVKLESVHQNYHYDFEFNASAVDNYFIYGLLLICGLVLLTILIGCIRQMKTTANPVLVY